VTTLWVPKTRPGMLSRLFARRERIRAELNRGMGFVAMPPVRRGELTKPRRSSSSIKPMNVLHSVLHPSQKVVRGTEGVSDRNDFGCIVLFRRSATHDGRAGQAQVTGPDESSARTGSIASILDEFI